LGHESTISQEAAETLRWTLLSALDRGGWWYSSWCGTPWMQLFSYLVMCDCFTSDRIR